MQNWLCTIENSVHDSSIFKIPGASILFRLLSTASDMQNDTHKFGPKKKAMSLKGILTNLAKEEGWSKIVNAVFRNHVH